MMVKCAVSTGAGFADERQTFWRGLVARMAAGEPAALGELYDASSAILYPLALRMMRSPQDAEEVLHDVYTRAWRNAGSYTETRGSVISWLILMTRSIAIDRLRALRRESKSVAPIEPNPDTPGSAPTPEASASNDERHTRVHRAMSALPPEQRQVIELAFFGGLTHIEVAETTSLPLGTVKTRIRSGLQRLRTHLEDVAL